MYQYRINLFIISSIIALLWLVPQGTGQLAKAKDTVTARIESRRVVDVCGQTKDQVIVVINLGKVLKSDSLFGFNFQLAFDSTKLRFHSALYLNTISEFFEFKQVGFFKNGHIVGACATMGSQPAAGDRPLIGFLGDYIGKCEDSAHVVFDYLEFTDEYTKRLLFNNGFVEALVADKPDRYLKFTADKDSTIIDTGSTKSSFRLRVEQGMDSTVTSLDVKLFPANFDNYYVESVETADSSLIEIEELIITDDSVDIAFFVKGKLNNKDIAVVNIAEKEKGEEVAEILVKPVMVNDGCSCFKHLLSSRHYIKSAQKSQDTTDTTTVAIDVTENENIFDYYSDMSNEWVIEAKDRSFRVTIYDVLGNLMTEYHGLSGISRISLDRFSSGIYYGIIQDSRNKIKRKILIKTNY